MLLSRNESETFNTDDDDRLLFLRNSETQRESWVGELGPVGGTDRTPCKTRTRKSDTAHHARVKASEEQACRQVDV